ncbi:hypothetical protein B0T11DRAFT_276310 [Plectosphaerella cucumerina]|uniref:Uncharacterized protein n=1 Tax=Plectosphaerella cucumerina TaxID=40658 RepID=A0A8K0X7K0_9PEZI|nr:hypothetical protein B0T11DRAFT_276310 [Plectosphaerella cucumerina]
MVEGDVERAKRCSGLSVPVRRRTTRPRPSNTHELISSQALGCGTLGACGVAAMWSGRRRGTGSRARVGRLGCQRTDGHEGGKSGWAGLLARASTPVKDTTRPIDGMGKWETIHEPSVVSEHGICHRVESSMSMWGNPYRSRFLQWDHAFPRTKIPNQITGNGPTPVPASQRYRGPRQRR